MKYEINKEIRTNVYINVSFCNTIVINSCNVLHLIWKKYEFANFTKSSLACDSYKYYHAMPIPFK